MGENICKWYDKWLKSNIHKQVKQLNIKKNPIKKWAEDWNRQFSQKRNTDGQRAPEKMPNIVSYQINATLNNKSYLCHLMSIWLVAPILDSTVPDS